MSSNQNKLHYAIFYGLSFAILVLWLAFYKNREQVLQIILVLLSISAYLVGVMIHIRPLTLTGKVRILRIAIAILFCEYILILIDVLFVGSLFLIGGRSAGAVNLIPFHSIANNLNDILIEQNAWSAVNLFGNILLFTPMGICLPIIFKRMRKISLFCIVIISLLVAVEVVQNLTQTGSTDIDDFILNFTGVILAWFITHSVIKLVAKRSRKD